MAVISSLVVKKKITKQKKKWYNEKIRLLKKTKENAREKYSYTNNDIDRLELLKIVKKYKEEIKAAKCREIQNKIEANKDDQKKLWKVLKSLYKDEVDDRMELEINGGVVNDKEEIATKLNEFFVESVEEIVRNIPHPRDDQYINRIAQFSSVFELQTIEMDDLLSIVKSLSKKTFTDNINTKVILDAVEDEKFACELLKFVNSSIEISTMP